MVCYSKWKTVVRHRLKCIRKLIQFPFLWRIMEDDIICTFSATPKIQLRFSQERITTCNYKSNWLPYDKIVIRRNNLYLKKCYALCMFICIAGAYRWVDLDTYILGIWPYCCQRGVAWSKALHHNYFTLPGVGRPDLWV